MFDLLLDIILLFNIDLEWRILILSMIALVKV
jgi:hypothetical protein